MSPSMVGGVVAVVAVIVVALALRAMGGGDEAQGSAPAMPTPTPPEPEPEPERDETSTPASDEVEIGSLDPSQAATPDVDVELAIGDVGTSDGRVFVPDGHVVRVLPALSDEERAQYEAATEKEWEARATYAWEKAYAPQLKYATRLRAPHVILDAGDLRAVRVVGPGKEGEPWRLETVGRDGEYETYPFEREADASEVLEMLGTRGVFQPFEDEDGHQVPPPAAMFEEARKVSEETAALLELPDDETGERQEGGL